MPVCNSELRTENITEQRQTCTEMTLQTTALPWREGSAHCPEISPPATLLHVRDKSAGAGVQSEISRGDPRQGDPEARGSRIIDGDREVRTDASKERGVSPLLQVVAVEVVTGRRISPGRTKRSSEVSTAGGVLLLYMTERA